MSKGTTPEEVKTKSLILRRHLQDELYRQTKQIVGRVLTIIDAVTDDSVRRKALHDLMEQAIYGQAEHLHDEIDLTCRDVSELLKEEWPKHLAGRKYNRSTIFNMSGK